MQLSLPYGIRFRPRIRRAFKKVVFVQKNPLRGPKNTFGHSLHKITNNIQMDMICGFLSGKKVWKKCTSLNCHSSPYDILDIGS